MSNGAKVRTSSVEGLFVPKNPYSRVASITQPSKLVITAGQLGADVAIGSDGRVIEGFRQQVRQALANLRTVLASEDMDVEDIMILNHYVVGAQDMTELNEERRAFLGAARPASTLLVVSGLANPQALYEVSAVCAR